MNELIRDLRNMVVSSRHTGEPIDTERVAKIIAGYSVSYTKPPLILVSREDAEAVARFAFNNAGKGLRSPVAAAGERLLDAIHKERG